MLGALAILLWSTTVAFSRSLTEQLGTLTAAAWIYLAAGAAGFTAIAFRREGFKSLRELPRIYLLGCGALFVAYIVTFYLALGLAQDRAQVLSVGLINYLWPALSLVFSIPILGRKARWPLPAGILLALGGTFFATMSGSGVQAGAISNPGSILPYLLALMAAVCWGLYSNLSRRWAGEQDGGGVPVFLLACGVILGVMRLFVEESSQWSVQTGAALAYMAIFPGMLAYVFWDSAVRRGDIILVASLSYLTPLLSTVFSALVLNVDPGAGVWLGALMVIAGAVICKISIVDPPGGQT